MAGIIFIPWRIPPGLNISKSRAIGNNRIFHATSALNYRAAFRFYGPRSTLYDQLAPKFSRITFVEGRGGGGGIVVINTRPNRIYIRSIVYRSNNENQLSSLSFYRKIYIYIYTCINKYFRRCCIAKFKVIFIPAWKKKRIRIHSAERVSSERFEWDRKPCASDDEIERRVVALDRERIDVWKYLWKDERKKSLEKYFYPRNCPRLCESSTNFYTCRFTVYIANSSSKLFRSRRVAPNDAKVVPLIKLPRQLSPGSETPPRCFVVLLRGHRRCNDCNARKEFVSNKRSSSASIYPSSIFFRNRVTEMCELS